MDGIDTFTDITEEFSDMVGEIDGIDETDDLEDDFPPEHI
jgi:hypothetical protein